MGKLAHRRAAGLAVLVLLLGLIPLVALAAVTPVEDGAQYPNFGQAGDICPNGQEGWSTHVNESDLASRSGGWGTAKGTGTSVEVTLNEGYELIVCVKSGAEAAGTGREFYQVTYEEDEGGEPITQIVSHSTGDLSHWSYRVVTTPTTEPTTPPTEPTQPMTPPAPGAIVIEKVSNIGTGTFQFTSPQLGPFALTTTATGAAGKVSTTFSSLQPGTYSVAETLPTPTSTPEETKSWTMTVSCSSGDEPSAITLAAGETVTCTFVNSLAVVRGIQVTTTTAPTTTTTAAVAASTLPFTGPGDDLMAVPVAMAVVAIGLIALLGATRPEEETIRR
ncbi:MAG: hypothetical protein R6X29_04260 [Acidimicrobiia bacterium]|jgi:hypothetical protein